MARPPYGGVYEEGRLDRSMRLIRESWRFLRRRPKLLVLPGLAALGTALASVVVLLPVLYWTRHLPGRLPLMVAMAVTLLPLTLVTTFFNVGFLAMVCDEAQGREPSVRRGLRFAGTRWKAILGWSLLSSLVGTLMSLLQNLPGGDWLGRLIGFVGGLAWSLASFFVVPVLVLERRGPIASVRRSAQVFRGRWGEAVVGDVAIGAVFGLATIPAFLLAAVAIAEYGRHLVTAAVLMTVAVLILAPCLAASATLGDLFRLAVYQHAQGQEPLGPFEVSDLDRAVKPRKKRFGR
jgi:hypothetical protein